MPDTIIGGIEGGATHSKIVLLNESGKVLAELKGPGTNHHLTGMPECERRIADMVELAKKEANLPLKKPLKTLGLSLSGCEKEETNNKMVSELIEKHPNLSENYAIGSDTVGSVATTSNKGGIVCIAGTGSNTLLINPDGTTIQCGGWGYLLGDEGSAWKVSCMAIKCCFDALDNFIQPPFPITTVWDAVKAHFKIETQVDMLDIFYLNFDKAEIAYLCKIISELAHAGDPLSQHIFRETGIHLARAISAVLAKASPVLSENEGGFQILCVGSVWLSWDLLKEGFVDWIGRNNRVEKFELMKLTSTSALGAAYMGADKAGVKVTRDYTKNYSVFYKYDKSNCFKEL